MFTPLIVVDVNFNPAAFYALWYVNGKDQLMYPVKLVGPLVGALLAGSICRILTPDDPNYKKPKRYLTIKKMKNSLLNLRQDR